jgi:hypothetical protein
VDDLAGIRDEGRVKVEVDRTASEPAAAQAEVTIEDLEEAENRNQDRLGVTRMVELRVQHAGGKRGAKRADVIDRAAYLAALNA